MRKSQSNSSDKFLYISISGDGGNRSRVTKCSHELRSLRALSTLDPDSLVFLLGRKKNIVPSFNSRRNSAQALLLHPHK